MKTEDWLGYKESRTPLTYVAAVVLGLAVWTAIILGIGLLIL